MRTPILLVALSVSSVAWADTPTIAPKCTILPQPDADCAMSLGRKTTIRLARIGVEMVLGTLFGAGLGSLGAYAGLNIDLATGNEAGVGLGLGTSFGVALGVAPGVWLGGLAMGGDGSFGWTLLGSALGTGLAASILAVDSSPGLLFLGATLPVSFSILAYELSSHNRKAHVPPPKPSARIIPSLGPRFVGIAGIF
jgi:hypothetical protein